MCSTGDYSQYLLITYNGKNLKKNIYFFISIYLGLPRWLSGKESTCQARQVGSVPELGRSLEKENGNLLQYSCLGNPMDRGA